MELYFYKLIALMLSVFTIILYKIKIVFYSGMPRAWFGKHRFICNYSHLVATLEIASWFLSHP